MMRRTRGRAAKGAGLDTPACATSRAEAEEPPRLSCPLGGGGESRFIVRSPWRMAGWMEKSKVAEFDVLVPVEGIAKISDEIEQRVDPASAVAERRPRSGADAAGAEHQGDHRDLASRRRRRRADAPPAQSADRRQLRRRLRPYRRGFGGRTRHHRHPYARRARRRSRRHRDGADDRDGARIAAGRALSARGSLAGGALSADGLAARPHDGHSRPRADRQGDRPAGRRLRPRRRLSRPQPQVDAPFSTTPR